MPEQLYLTGWINGTPGEGSMWFNMPDNIEDASFDFHVQNPADEDLITVVGRVDKEPIYGGEGNWEILGTRCTAVISWENRSYRSIAFDYDVAPYTTSTKP